uniref:Uncharacterized protein n=1 Tax=Anguilla anguilla TaxID=7936 RepID=A0A0E9TV10_ANGAN
MMACEGKPKSCGTREEAASLRPTAMH